MVKTFLHLESDTGCITARWTTICTPRRYNSALIAGTLYLIDNFRHALSDSVSFLLEGISALLLDVYYHTQRP